MKQEQTNAPVLCYNSVNYYERINKNIQKRC